jgi:protein-S-isoprenylcysteine O-methyltransferase Ste14
MLTGLAAILAITHLPGPSGLAQFLFLGVALVFHSSAGTAAAAFFTVLFLNRIPREEPLMAREFTACTRRTRWLLPGFSQPAS